MTVGRQSIFLGQDQSDTTIIGNFSSIAGGVYIHGPDNHACVRNRKLVTTSGFFEDQTLPGYSKGTVKIGNDVWIGEDVKILNGVHIGDGAIIGAHAVIAKDVPPFAVVVGNPQVIKKYRFSKKIVEKLLLIQWWHWEDNLVKEREADFVDVNKFVKKYS